MAEYDNHRPIYHFMPPSGWMNDPNGPITESDGTHHLFYQYNPDGGWHEQMHWGHARTRDLVHWEHMPIALYPDSAFDKDGVYSGSAIELNGQPVLFYTGIRPEVQCIAIGDERYEVWRKLPRPIVSDRPEGVELDGFRDPTLWFDPVTGRLNMGIGSGIVGESGCVLRYSADPGLKSAWQHEGFLLRGHPALLANCECPDFWHHDTGTWAMIASPQADNPRRGAGTVWLTGEQLEGEFFPNRQGLLDASPLYYAPKSFWHKDGRRVVWGWLREDRSVDKSVGREWAGVMSLPREVEIGSDGVLSVRLSPEVKSLSGWRAFACEGDEAMYSANVAAVEIPAKESVAHLIEMEWTPWGKVAIQLLNGQFHDESVVVAYDFTKQELSLSLRFQWEGDESVTERTTVCGVNRDLPNPDGQFALQEGEPLRLLVYMDRSVIEVFANDRAALSGRYYPKSRATTSPDPLYLPVRLHGDSSTSGRDSWNFTNPYSISATSQGRPLRITTWEVWNLASIWSE